LKFTDKYELLESLTTGAVETFVANDKVRGERVLVHIVESAAPRQAGQSTLEWVLESFRRVAPDPSGPVLETGKYLEAKYVYLVTRPADEAALHSWVRRYEIQGLDTQETRTHPQAIESSAPPVAPPPVIETERAPVSVTQLLRDFDSQIKPAKPEPTLPAGALPNVRLGADQSGLHSAAPWEPDRSEAPAPAKPQAQHVAEAPDSFAREAKDAGFPSASFRTPSAASGVRDTSKTGEFSSFFRGPFRGDGTSEIPALSSEPIEPPRKTVGEFTAVFGSAGSRPEPAASSLEESGNSQAPSTFTGMFRDMEAPSRSVNAPPGMVTQAPLEPLPLPQAKESTPGPMYVAPPPPVAPPKPAVLPPLPNPSLSSQRLPAARRGSLPGDGATGVFSPPAANGPAPVQPAEPAGPSPYTQVISRDPSMTADAAAEAKAKSAAPAATGRFAAPTMPRPPAMMPPQMPHAAVIPPPMPHPVMMPAPMPHVPQVRIPSPPMMPPPAAPKMPRTDAPAPPVSMMPLAIILTALFFLAVLLVLYFVLKH